MATSSSRSFCGLWCSASRSTLSSRSKSSRWACIDTYSPAPIENAPATSPASPARRTKLAPGLAPATPSISETFVTNPSLTPKTAARAPPPRTSRCGASWPDSTVGRGVPGLAASSTALSVATHAGSSALAESAHERSQVDRPLPAPDPPGGRDLLLHQRRPGRHLRAGRDLTLAPAVGPGGGGLLHRQRAPVGLLGGGGDRRRLHGPPAGGVRHVLPQPLRRAAAPLLDRAGGPALAPPEPGVPEDLVPLTAGRRRPAPAGAGLCQGRRRRFTGWADRTDEERAMTTVVKDLDELKGLVGRHLGYSDWLTITQERVDAFADATDDH